MNLKEIKRSVLRFLGNHLINFLVPVLCKTLRFEVINFDAVSELDSKGQNYVTAFWHSSMLIPWYLQRERKFAALVSQSKDGEILTRLLQKWDYKVARGSSNIGGKEALEILISYAETGYKIAVTPDGPKGPPYKMKAGAAITAKKVGIPLFLCAVGIKNYWELNSWDSFQIPKFFTTVKVVYSSPKFISRELNYEETSAKILELESELNLMQKEASKF